MQEIREKCKFGAICAGSCHAACFKFEEKGKESGLSLCLDCQRPACRQDPQGEIKDCADYLPPKPRTGSLDPETREALGYQVRVAWVEWAETQDDPKDSWLVPWEDLDEDQKEADRCIGEAVARYVADRFVPAFTEKAEQTEKINGLIAVLNDLAAIVGMEPGDPFALVAAVQSLKDAAERGGDNGKG